MFRQFSRYVIRSGILASHLTLTKKVIQPENTLLNEMLTTQQSNSFHILKCSRTLLIG